MLIQLHIIRNFTTNNLNRGKSGAPKTTFIGGGQRAILSSQTIKRSIRMSPIWRNGITRLGGDLAQRTRLLPEDVAGSLARKGVDKETADLIVEKASQLFKKDRSVVDEDDTNDETATEDRVMTGQALFYGANEAERITNILLAAFEQVGAKGWKKIKGEVLQRKIRDSKVSKKGGSPVPLTVDVALFGRMVTSEAIETVESALQVAKAVGVHRYSGEVDFFTAVDDRLLQAALPSEQIFTSNTFYFYYNLHLEQLEQNLAGAGIEARAVVPLFLKAAAMATPTGNQNNSAAHNYPDVILVELSEDNVPISYSNAFVAPVKPGPAEDMVMRASAAMVEHATEMAEMYGLQYRRGWATTKKIEKVEGWQHYSSLDDLAGWVNTQLGG